MGGHTSVIVLDTQAWIWWLHEPTRLSIPAAKRIKAAEGKEDIKVSVISVWEIALKTQIGKLSLPLEIREWYRQASLYPHIEIEDLSAIISIESTQLPGNFHKDPADRMITALARHYGAQLITSDEKICAYAHVDTVW